MRFAVDCMLGKLAKWLKILGFDTVFFSKIEDAELIGLAKQEDRVLLTRDTGIAGHSTACSTFLIESEYWPEQIDQVLNTLNLWPDVKTFSRCLECNCPLNELPKERARNLVTPYILENAEAFALCPECSKVYWKGTHHQDMSFF